MGAFGRLLRANTGYADKAEKLIEHTFFVLLNILLNHLISYLGIILPRLRFVLQAVVWVGVGTQWLVAAVSQFLSLALPSRHAFVSNAGCGFWAVMPLRFRIAFPAIPCENKCCFCACFLSHTMLCLHHLREKKGKGAKQQTFRFAKSKL